MSKIEKINLNKTVDYSDEKIAYFICDDDKTQLENYSCIINKIKNATKVINIASTTKISDDIIDALYQNEEVNLYMIVKSFDSAKDTLQRFDSKKPTVIREVESLDNNFIIIDNISYLFINSLSNKTNISIEYNEKYTKDLSFIFKSYFWGYATKEKLVDKIADPVESPFPPIGNRNLEYVNMTSSEFANCTALYIPKDKKFINMLDKESKSRFFSEDLDSTVFMNEEYTQVGKLKFLGLKFDFTNRWCLKNNSIKDIDLTDEIIPKNDNWNKTISIIKSEDMDLGSIVSETIENMKETEPEDFTGKSYVRSINYSWSVLPPSKPSEAKKSSLYNEYDKLNKDYQEQLKQLEHQLNDLERESGLLNKWFIGENRKAKQNLKQIEEYKAKDLKKLNIADLDNFLSNDFKNFYENIIQSDKDFKSNKKRKEAEKKWKDEKAKKEDTLGKKNIELSSTRDQLKKITQQKEELQGQIEEIKSLQSKDEKYDTSKEIEVLENKEKDLKDNQKEQTKLEKSIKNQINEIQKIKEEMTERYTLFEYTPKENEIKNIQKHKEEEYKELKPPKYSLPEVGVLYETKKEYFLEIVDYDDLDKANELKQRYEDKEYKVVVGDNDE